MRKTLLFPSIVLLATSGFVNAGEHPTFNEADTNQDGTLSLVELTAAIPNLQLQSTGENVNVADVKRVMPEVEFNDIDVVNSTPIGEKHYVQIVDAIEEKESSGNVSAI